MTRSSFHDEPLAIIGMACRLPGAPDLEAYWRLVRDGASAITEVPVDRLDPALYFHPERGVPGRTYSRIGGIVADRPLDRAVCDVPEALAIDCDIAHLAMVEVAATACRHAGLDPLALPIRNAGVYVGHARGSALASEIAYATHVEELVRHLPADVEAFRALRPEVQEAVGRDVVRDVRAKKPRRGPGGRPDTAPSVAAALIAQTFGLTGPYMVVDAVCASSLYALALAAHALHAGRIEMAVVGAASYNSWQSFVLFSHAQALSATRSRPFDARADGFVSADGYAALVVKTLPRALADGDAVHAVIRGLGLASDGHGKSLWAPRKEGQVEAMRRAHAQGADPSRIQYVEAHGTSTQLGDATEMEALTEALGPHLPRGVRIPVASVKGNIGHSRETAGLAGIIKTVLAMRHGVVPPAAGFEVPNPGIDWERIPFFVPTVAQAWPAPADGGPRRAALDAFGIGGVNAHVVLDEFRPAAPSLALPGADLPIPDLATVAGERASAPAASGAAERAAAAIAIVGLGALFPGALTADRYWALLASGTDPKSEVPPDRWDPSLFHEAGTESPWRSPVRTGGFVTDFAYDWKTHKIPPRQLESADPLQFMLLEAVDQALADAGYRDRPFDHRRTAVIVGTMFGGDHGVHLSSALHLPELERDVAAVLARHGVAATPAREMAATFAAARAHAATVLRDDSGSYSSSTLASRVARTLDLMGGAFALDAGEASSLAALTAAVDLLRAEACDTVICVGAQRAMDVSAQIIFARRGLLARRGPHPASEEGAEGFALGEGVGAVVLKRLDDARRDRDPVRAVVRGIGVRTERDAPGRALRGAIEAALAEARLEPAAVAAVEAAGTGVAEVDRQEAGALAETYGRAPRDAPLLVGSVRAQIGHTLGASGMASLLKMALALGHGEMPGSPAASRPVAGLAVHPDRLMPANAASVLRATSPDAPAVGGVSALAFRGSAYHVLLEQGHVAAPAGSWQIVRLGAEDQDALAARLVGDAGQVARLGAEAASFGFTAADRSRLAIVARDEATLAHRLRLAREQLGRPAGRAVLEEQGVFYRVAPAEAPRVALLFAGQGSQYPGMLRELTRDLPAARIALQDADLLMARLGHRTFSEMAWGPDSRLGTDVWETQAAVLLADTIVHAALSAIGVRADVVSAHSFGEYPALVATGAWTLEQAVRATRVRCSLLEGSALARGVMLSTTAPPATVERLVAEAGQAWVANHNAPDQTVVGGEAEAVLALQSRLLAEGFQCQMLVVPRPFHTPLLADVQAPFEEALAGEPLRPPRVPLLSSVTNRYTADPLDLRVNLVAQLTRPLRYVDLVERLAADGVTVFVEVGPGQTLTRLHRRILADRDVLLLASDNAKRPGLEALTRVQAALEVAGVPLEAPGTARPPARPRPPLAPVRGRPESVLHFDATLRRKQKLASVAKAPADAAPPEPAREPDELATLLIRFVCEETGYPPEVVDLDADLEADLGVDSIRKARLLGELRDRFDIRSDSVEALSLDQFPTLRHVLEFLRGAGIRLDDPAASRAPSTLPTTGVHRSTASAGVDGIAAATGPGRLGTAGAASVAGPVATAEPPLDAPRILRCGGSPYEMGARQGREQAEHIRRAIDRYCTLLGRRFEQTAENMTAFRQIVPSPDDYFTPAALEELRGMAAALDLPVEYLAAFNLGLYPEYVGGCVQFAITARENGTAGLVHAANEDWPLTVWLPDSLRSAFQVRHPADGIPHLIHGVAGQIGGLTGVNARGVAVTSTMLLDREWRSRTAPGTIHPVLVGTVLSKAENVDAAVAIVESLARTGAWSLCVSDQSRDEIAYLEYEGDSLEVRRGETRAVTTNHGRLRPSKHPVPEHSRHRLARLHSLLEGAAPTGVTAERARSVLRDRFDEARQREVAHPTMNTIQRVDNRVSVVMSPAQGEAWVLTADGTSPEAAPRYHRLDLRALLAPPEASTAAPPSLPAAAGLPAATSPAEPPGRPGPAGDDAVRDHPDRVMSRFVLRVVEAPLPAVTDETRVAPRLAGHALVLGDNPVAALLATRLAEAGLGVATLAPDTQPEAAVVEMERLWRQQPIPHLFLLTARDEEAACRLDEPAWGRRRDAGLLLPYRVCQRWTRLVTEAGLVRQATLVAATALGGDFGFGGRGAAIEGGGLAGLLKAIRHELDGLTVKVVDGLAEEAPARVVDAIWTELAGATGEVEVGYVRGRRRLPRAVPRWTGAGPRRALTPGGTWVVTGGGRGITAFVARELGQRFGLRLHLVGTLEPPAVDDQQRSLTEEGFRGLKATVTRSAREAGRDPAAAWRRVERSIELDRTLHSMAEAGVDATYHPCDVSDRAALATVLDRVRRAAGPIHGVLHGAGLEAAARFDKKPAEAVRASIAAKLDGAAALMALTRQDPLAFFVAFGSVSGRFGGIGQTDYSLASDALAKLVQWFRAQRPECAAVAVHWPGWDDVGMASRPESRLAIQLSGQRLMPPREGLLHLVDELEAGLPEGEVLIVDRASALDRDGTLPPPEGRWAFRWRRDLVAASPLIEGLARLDEDRELVADLRFDPTADPFLLQHLFHDVPLLPAVVALEALAEAATLLDPELRAVGFRDVEIASMLPFPDGQPQDACVRVTAAGDRVSAELTRPFYDRRGRLIEPSRVAIRGIVERAESPTLIDPPRPPEPPEWHAMRYVERGEALEQGLVYHGPALRALQQIALGADQAWGRIGAAPLAEIGGHRPPGWLLPAAALDACLVACGVFARLVLQARQLPHGFEQLRLGRPPRPGEDCRVHVLYRGRHGERTRFDFTLFGSDGSALLLAEGYQATSLTGR